MKNINDKILSSLNPTEKLMMIIQSLDKGRVFYNRNNDNEFGQGQISIYGIYEIQCNGLEYPLERPEFLRLIDDVEEGVLIL
ncbi:hypothetical protein [Halalkalibacter nanhaiisediminis]|uniref:Uncharacterized protein n=1 Tax=Halalkalibacter nanhaiisediminis TaxID=688079 RepID=A0A562QHF6_9BACI|nr:hypothetical protein [Halalkalibacter nanhaiisediminis]TWI56103.1 hypothetical protein IQ10_01992 [Halalkalibacter nanhaiisediminis]